MNKKVKTLSAIILLMLGTTTFVSCGGNDEDEQTETHEGHDHEESDGDEHEGHDH